MRLEPRVPVELSLELTYPPPRDEEGLCLDVVNLSGSGALCRSPIPMAVRSQVEGRIVLPSPDGKNATLLVRALVLRSDPVEGAQGHEHIVALHFDELETDQKKTLRRFVFTVLAENISRDGA